MLSKLATQVHRENVSDLDISWLLFQSNSICVWCVHRKSENSLFCKHVICNMCVRIYENEMLIMNCQYHIKTCLLCCSENCIVRLKSFVADERILTIDEKDTHDVISLEIMTIIQSMIESELQIQDFLILRSTLALISFTFRSHESSGLNMKQKISLSVSYFYVTCQFHNVFTFSMH